MALLGKAIMGDPLEFVSTRQANESEREQFNKCFEAEKTSEDEKKGAV